ncbi:putative nuclease HARBI1 [Anopheles moucheti]|uniref:putative nuclease HARBI1 n=1 Tax=Anopheles moucheti TaxID=186751 RepID=UPI0022EFE32A|nr:putative nuclease HARBI1 [Anopheles moucheti]
MAYVKINEERLISLVQECRLIWDLGDPKYKNNRLKKAAWDEIGGQLNVPGIVAKNKWRGLREVFSRKLAETRQPSGSGYKHIRWKFFHQMNFLKDSLASRPRKDNLEAAVEQESEEYLEEFLEEEDRIDHAGGETSNSGLLPIPKNDKQPSGQTSAGRSRRETDGALLEELVALEKERHAMVSKKSGNYHAMMSLVELMDMLTVEDQIDAREEILRFGHRVLKEKLSSYKHNTYVDLAAYRRQLRKNLDPMSLSDTAFQRNFRLNKTLFNHVLQMIESEITPHHNRGLSAKEKLAATLKFLAQGSYQQGVGNDFTVPMAQSTFSEVLDETLRAMEKELARYISLEMTENEKSDAVNYFYQKSGITGVVMCVDGSHVRILAPHDNPAAYYNRKGYYSLNVLMICDNRKLIRFVDARFSGSNHDSCIFSMSPAYGFFEQKWRNGDRMFKLLGGSAYPAKPWLIKPHRNATPNSPEANFNQRLSKARTVIENTFGVLKGKFRCILGERLLRYAPSKCARIINVCCALHNLCIIYNIPEEIL